MCPGNNSKINYLLSESYLQISISEECKLRKFYRKWNDTAFESSP
jgi:hypothetical protein